jgi:LPXTG-motif cell wall-anchored protein
MGFDGKMVLGWDKQTNNSLIIGGVVLTLIASFLLFLINKKK